MHRNATKWIAAGAAVVVTAGIVWATPNPTGIVFNERVFNDCPGSTLTTTDSYPALVAIEDQNLSCNGFANLHNWHFSEDGITDAVFDNDSHFQFSADLVIDGTGEGEAGLQVAPWWSQNVDGRFNVKTAGEIACFGGRLPFFSFTSTYGLNYVKGETIGLEVIYDPHDLSETNPATIEYIVHYGGTFSSGPLPFDMANPDEDPPYGLWGMLNDARVGGYCQLLMDPGNNVGVRVEWRSIGFENLDTTPIIEKTWGGVKSQFR
ncbi:MAG: hypothetical protein H6682_07450 [Candidatus Eisenbacteria bacterium]|nr:hypothetical protein [Candidatus Eisenbacteria bacterium]